MPFVPTTISKRVRFSFADSVRTEHCANTRPFELFCSLLFQLHGLSFTMLCRLRNTMDNRPRRL